MNCNYDQYFWQILVWVAKAWNLSAVDVCWVCTVHTSVPSLFSCPVSLWSKFFWLMITAFPRRGCEKLYSSSINLMGPAGRASGADGILQNTPVTSSHVHHILYILHSQNDGMTIIHRCLLGSSHLGQRKTPKLELNSRLVPQNRTI